MIDTVLFDIGGTLITQTHSDARVLLYSAYVKLLLSEIGINITESDKAFYDRLRNNAEAYKHIGARYRYGSKGPNAFDCSGFTSFVYKKSNMNIGASSREQYARNIPIKREDLQPGDLVFFTSPGSRRGVGHVGIVVDYDPISNVFTFIHASTSSGVKLSKSSESNYARRYVGARRVQN